MPTDDRLLLLTSQAQLYALPLASAVAGAHTFATLKPALSLKPHHGCTLQMAIDHRGGPVLAVLGEGSRSKVLPGLSLTMWSAQGAQLKLLNSCGLATVSKSQHLESCSCIIEYLSIKTPADLSLPSQLSSSEVMPPLP